MSRVSPQPDARSTLLVVRLQGGEDVSRPLRAARFAVTAAKTVEAALARARAAPPDAVVIQTGAPDPRVLELCRSLRDTSATRLTPVVLWCAEPLARNQRHAALQAGAWECLADEPEDLVARLQTFVRVKREAERVQSAGLIDAATGLYNRQGLARVARELTSQAFRAHASIACVAFGVDWGSADERQNQEIIARCAAALQRRSRLSDVVGRLGPHEFAVLAPATTAAGAEKLARRLEQFLAAAAQAGGEMIRVRGGIEAVGNAGYAPFDPTTLLLRAATALHEGRTVVGTDWLRHFVPDEEP